MPNSNYFVVTKAFPVNIELTAPIPDASGKETFRVRPEKMPEELVFARTPLESFTFNDVFALQAECELRHPVTGQTCNLVFQLLPVGTLVLHIVHPAPVSASCTSATELREFGTDHYRADDYWSEPVYEILADLERQKVISYCPVAPFDILQGQGRSKHWKQVDAEMFRREMAWRAWASGSYVTLGDQSDGEATDWQACSECPERPPQPTKRGQVSTLWTNYFGWSIQRFQEDGDRSDAAVLAHELEPVAYMISRRSQCASGFHNVRQLAKLIASDGHNGFNNHDMRVYLSSTRLALLAPKEFEESTATTSRNIYRQACDDLEIEKHTSDFYDGINALVEDIKGVNAEREEKAERRLNHLVMFLSVVLSITFISDIADFLIGESKGFSFADRLEILIVGSAIFLPLVILLFIVSRLTARRR